jgi:hypothetical protein
MFTSLNGHLGKVAAYNSKRGMHKVTYKDGEDETLRLGDEDIYFEDSIILNVSVCRCSAGFFFFFFFF